MQGEEGKEVELRKVALVESHCTRQRGSFAPDSGTVFIEGDDEQKTDSRELAPTLVANGSEQETKMASGSVANGALPFSVDADAVAGANSADARNHAVIAGKLVLRFDNSFSRFTSKTLLHRVAVA